MLCLCSQVTAAPNKSSLSKENQEQVDGVGDTEKSGFFCKAAPATSVGVTSENGGSTHHLVRVSASSKCPILFCLVAEH